MPIILLRKDFVCFLINKGPDIVHNVVDIVHNFGRDVTTHFAILVPKIWLN